MIYLDSCIVIYAVESVEPFVGRVRRWLRSHLDDDLVVSPLVKMECLVGPLKHRDSVLEARYLNSLAGLASVPVTEEAFLLAARLRAEHRLKTPDALHLATATLSGCSSLLTNDDRLHEAAGGLAEVLT